MTIAINCKGKKRKVDRTKRHKLMVTYGIDFHTKNRFETGSWNCNPRQHFKQVSLCKNTHYFRKVKTFGKNFIKTLFEISCKPKDKEPDEETYPCCCYDSDNPHSDFVAYGGFGLI